MITQEKLKELLEYNPETGIFTNKVTRNSRAVKGKELNPLNNGRYGTVTIDKRKYFLHKLAWFYIYGNWPNNIIDHINRDTADNRLFNLREATKGQNNHNSKAIKGTSNYKGVYLDRNKWRAHIRNNGIRINLGSFNTEIEAAKAYDVKAVELYGEFAYIT